MDENIAKLIRTCRGAMEISEYKIIFIQLLLLKYISENKEFRIEFASIVDLAEKNELTKEYLEKVITDIEVSTKGKSSKKTFNDVFDLSSVSERNIGYITNTILQLNEIDITNINTMEIMEYFAQKEGAKSGINNTPLCVNKLVVKLVTTGIESGTVSVQACGVASMLLQSGNEIDVEKYYGQEISSEIYHLAKSQMIMNNIPFDKFEIKRVNTIEDDSVFGDKKYDVQISNPPYGMPWSGNVKLLMDDRFKKYGVLPPKSSADLLFIEHALYHMADGNSRAAVITNIKALNTGSTVAAIRKQIIIENKLDAVIKLSGNSMFNTAIPVFILIFKNQKDNRDVFYIDASSFFEGSRRKEISEENIKRVVEIYTDRKEINDICCNVSLEEIEANDYKLGTERYINKRKLKRLLENDALVSLKDVVEIIKPKVIGSKGMVLSAESATYPIDYENLREDEATDVVLKKGDIIIRNSSTNLMYLVDEEPEETIYGGYSDIILRPFNIQAEYLLLFFKSDIGKQIIETECPSIIGLTRIHMIALNEMKVALPKRDSAEYRKIFEIENCLRIDISSYNTLLANKDKYFGTETIEDVLSQELVSNVKTYKQEAMKTFLFDDIRELNACFNAKAYKATLILAGSILEAILIDWLSEIKGMDYFDENNVYKVKKVKRDRNTGAPMKDRNGDVIYFEKDAVLADYINEIKAIEKPNWMKEARMAHVIREKRNLVHAKLGINSDDITATTCKQVIGYLNDILKTRGIE